MKIGFWQLNYFLMAGFSASIILAIIDFSMGISFLGNTGWLLHAVLAGYNMAFAFTRLIATMQVPFMRDQLLAIGQPRRRQNIRETILAAGEKSFGYLTVLDRGKAIAGIGLALVFGSVVIYEMPNARPLLQFLAFGTGNQLGVIAFFTPWLFKPSCALVNRFVEIKEKPRAT